MNTTITDVLDSKIQAERGRFFQNIFESSRYLDVDTSSLADVLTQQIAEWNDFHTKNNADWVAEVKEQLNDQTEEELAIFYENIINERKADVRLILSKIFANHQKLSVETSGDTNDFPTITLSVDQCYKDNNDSYYANSQVEYQHDHWNYDFDCSWKDFLSYAEYN